MHLTKMGMAVLSGLLFPLHALADCTASTADGMSYFVATSPDFNPPSFNPATIPIGGVIYSGPLSIRFQNAVNNTTAKVACTSSIYQYMTGIGTPNGNIYPTSVPNIGVRIRTNAGQYYPLRASSPTGSIFYFAVNAGSIATIELIKTGNITAPGTLSGAYARSRVNTEDGQVLVEYRFASPVQIIPRVPTCKVAKSSVDVPVGTVLAKKFTGVGSVSPEKSFSISLNCSGGDAGTSLRPYVTLTDNTNQSNVSTRLSLTPQSTASGIDIQILKDGTVLSAAI